MSLVIYALLTSHFLDVAAMPEMTEKLFMLAPTTATLNALLLRSALSAPRTPLNVT